MFELWMLWFTPLAIVAAGFLFGIAAYALGYDPMDVEEVADDA